ncbi:MAG: dihydrolipoamide acetyltransferase family protein [Pseudorhodobacter sp.]|nr:dihydrolipoamide acetyltransferase family protein [Pseudorhodobacter sp.]
MGLFVMPSLGADMESAKLVEWRVKPGDTVARGDVVAVVETQKGAIEIEIFEAGEVVALEAGVGHTLPVGALLARVRAPGEVLAATPATPPERQPETPVEIPPEPAPEPPEAPGRDLPAPSPIEMPDEPLPEIPPDEPFGVALPAGPPASPAARTRAAAAGLALSSLHGSGPGGAILLVDVERHLSSAPAPPPSPGLDMAQMRKAIAAAMVRSKREIPHYYLSHTIDLQPAADWLATFNAGRAPDTRLLMGALFLKATVCAVAKVPELNGVFTKDGFIASGPVNAGLVVALRGGGLIAPAIRDAEALSLDALMVAMRDIVIRARSGRLRNSELTAGTMTVSTMGETGAEVLYGVIYPPQVALVGFGAPVRRAWVVGDALAPRRTVTVSLAADHRVSDGRRGARLLTEIERLLMEPMTL